MLPETTLDFNDPSEHDNDSFRNADKIFEFSVYDDVKFHESFTQVTPTQFFQIHIILFTILFKIETHLLHFKYSYTRSAWNLGNTIIIFNYFKRFFM